MALPRLLHSSERRNAKRVVWISPISSWQKADPTNRRLRWRMTDNNTDQNQKLPGGWSERKRRLEIEFFARTNGITKRQANELMKKYGENDYATLVSEARWLRE